MANMTKLIPWIIALAALTITGILYWDLQALQEKTENLSLENDTLKQQITKVTKAHSEALPQVPAASMSETIPDFPNTAPPPDFDLDALFGDMIQEIEAAPEMPVPTESEEEIADNDGREEGGEWDRRREEWQSRAFDFHFDALVNEMGFSPETAEMLLSSMREFREQESNLRSQLRNGELSEEEADAERLALDAARDEELARLLTPQELEQYQHYQDTMPERMAAHSLDRQLSEHEGINALTREMLVQSFQNHLSGDSLAGEGMPIDPFTRSNMAYAVALEELKPQMSQDEYTQAQDFLEERMRQQAVMVERMSNWHLNRGSNGRRGGGFGPPSF